MSSPDLSPTFMQLDNFGNNKVVKQLISTASGMAQEMMSWAKGAYSKSSGITDRAVSELFKVSNKMNAFADKIDAQYTNTFMPLNQSIVDEANTYTSEARLRQNMGEAGATAAQAGKSAMDNATEELQKYGIDPSSGRYAALDKAMAVQNSANIAGEMNKQRRADITTGQTMRMQAAQLGSALPGYITAASGVAAQAAGAAGQAGAANANAGANLMKVPAAYQGLANDAAKAYQIPGGGGGGSGGGKSDGGGSRRGQPSYRSSDGGGNSSYTGMGGGGDGASYGGGGSRGGGSKTFTGDGGDDYGFETGFGTVGDPLTGSVDYVGSNPFSDFGFGQTYDYGGATQGYGGQSGTGSFYDAGANSVSTGWGNTYDSVGSWPGESSGGFNDYGLSYEDGGPVPAEMSPSGGQFVDDVPAEIEGMPEQEVRLNSDEFVIPRDVALWKGQEFFQNLIAQSRQKLSGAPAKPKSAPQQSMR